MNVSGFSFWYPMLMSMTIFAGSMEFVMTALFVVIFMEQWMKDRVHTSELIGLGISLLSLLVFGADNFIIPAMLCIMAVLSILKTRTKRGQEKLRKEETDGTEGTSLENDDLEKREESGLQ